ncbi:MAG: (d)CMP kinase, partial [Candidatus Omnitrophica bacterium]|nr:(d)CMP kinase [Candidatus Omnitrophota bacterium]
RRPIIHEIVTSGLHESPQYSIRASSELTLRRIDSILAGALNGNNTQYIEIVIAIVIVLILAFILFRAALNNNNNLFSSNFRQELEKLSKDIFTDYVWGHIQNGNHIVFIVDSNSLSAQASMYHSKALADLLRFNDITIDFIYTNDSFNYYELEEISGSYGRGRVSFKATDSPEDLHKILLFIIETTSVDKILALSSGNEYTSEALTVSKFNHIPMSIFFNGDEDLSDENVKKDLAGARSVVFSNSGHREELEEIGITSLKQVIDIRDYEEALIGDPEAGYVVNISGFSNTGKSTVARAVAKALGGVRVDIGSFFRSFSAYFLQLHQTTNFSLEDETAIAGIISTSMVHLNGDDFIINKTPINANDMRTPAVETQMIAMQNSEAISKAIVKRASIITKPLSRFQPVIYTTRGLIPKAIVNILVTTPFDQRTRRLQKDFAERGESLSIEECEKRLRDKDERENRGVDYRGFLNIENPDDHLDEAVDNIVSLVREALRKKTTVDFATTDFDRLIHTGIWQVISRRLKGRDEMKGSEQRFLKGVPLKSAGRFYVQLNPGRNPVGRPEIIHPGSVVQEYREDQQHFEDNPASKTYMYESLIDGEPVAFWAQVSPDAPYHINFMPNIDEKRPQVFEERDFRKALIIQRCYSRSSRFLIYGNSLGGLASINNLHMQAIYYHHNHIPLDIAERKYRITLEGVKVFSIGDDPNVFSNNFTYPVRGLFFSSDNINNLARVAATYLRWLQYKEDMVHRFAVTKAGLYIMIYPRRDIQDWIEKYADSGLTGWLETVQGDLKVFVQENFDREWSEEEIFNLTRTQSEDKDSFEKVYQAWLEDQSNQLFFALVFVLLGLALLAQLLSSTPTTL